MTAIATTERPAAEQSAMRGVRPWDSYFDQSSATAATSEPASDPRDVTPSLKRSSRTGTPRWWCVESSRIARHPHAPGASGRPNPRRRPARTPTSRRSHPKTPAPGPRSNRRQGDLHAHGPEIRSLIARLARIVDDGSLDKWRLYPDGYRPDSSSVHRW